jgi:hypothetical protein
MKKIIFLLFIAGLLIPAAPALAVSPEGEHYINQIVGGGYSSLRQAAQGIYRNELTERKVLDVLSEKLLQSYNDKSKTGVDAVAWACKALGRSGKIRYKNVLKTVSSNAASAKVRKYAKQSLKQMPGGKAEKPYEAGSIDLAKLRKKLEKGNSAVSSSGKAKNKSGKKRGALSAVRKGMSIQEVTSLIGEPTSSTSHITGKTFNPFYYGSDHARVIHLYKGQGRVLYSQRSSYSNTWRVMEVQIDPSEPGYP